MNNVYCVVYHTDNGNETKIVGIFNKRENALSCVNDAFDDYYAEYSECYDDVSQVKKDGWWRIDYGNEGFSDYCYIECACSPND